MNNLLDYVDQLEINIPLVPLDKLQETACLKYNEMWLHRDQRRRPVDPSWPKWFLDRITVNMLKHNFFQYDAELNKMADHPDSAAGMLRLKFRVLERIAAIYPDLARECARQLDRARRQSEE